MVETSKITPEELKIFEEMLKRDESEKSKPITIFKKDDYLCRVRSSVEEILRDNSRIVMSRDNLPSQGELLKGCFGTDMTIYEIIGEGVILQQEALLNPSSYFSKVYLLGFNESNPVYLDRKRRLEAIANKGDKISN